MLLFSPWTICVYLINIGQIDTNLKQFDNISTNVYITANTTTQVIQMHRPNRINKITSKQ